MTKHRPTYYAIRRKADGYTLPWPSGQTVGRTQVEPASPLIVPPRLYANKAAANMALSHWCRGVVLDRRGSSVAQDRNRDDFEIADVVLDIREPKDP